MAEAYLGIDFGTSGARACVIDGRREPLAEAHIGFTLEARPQAPTHWRECLLDLIARLPARLRARLRAVALDGTSSTCLLLDRNARPLDVPLLYHDMRATREAAELAQLAPPDAAVHSASSSLAKLLWYARNAEFSRAGFFAHQADWLALQLHGQPGLSDYHNGLKLGVDVEALRYPDWLLSLPVARVLPQILSPGKAIGPIMHKTAQALGLPHECIVRSGTTDSIAAFLATGARQAGHALTSLGSTLVIKSLSHTRVDAPAFGLYSHRLGPLWLVGGASNTGGAVLRRFFDDGALEALSAQIQTSTASPLDYYPLLAPGERFPINDPAYPPRLSPRPADDRAFLHGLLEGIARIEGRGYELLMALGATPVQRILTAGGGAGNAPWARIRARVTGLPVEAAARTEAAYGAALLAACGEKLLCFG
ncbi:MAG: FGGY-family carbohydrate kinase [Betaproteobacteria bacterium]|nr:FGGY-family carbohydrate kinase [Betaproteobacteria bacterium]